MADPTPTEVKTTDILALLGSLDDGAIYADLQDDLGEIVSALKKRVAQSGGSAKAKLTIQLRFGYDGKIIEVVPDVATQLPRPVRGKGVFWATKDNQLSPQNPQQLDLGVGRDVAVEKPRTLNVVS